MSIWIFVWASLSGTLIVFLIWTLMILRRQKRAWKAFAEKRGFEYLAGSISDPPQMRGKYNGYEVQAFPTEHQSEDERRARKFSSFEITLRTAPHFQGVVATGGLIAVSQAIFDTGEGLDPAFWLDA